ncbi:MAG: hypothetical protein FWD57_10350 [Polyangiaceae bacterium]|nr:hypothetical protein [Polyangiaceae bacterium]
MLSAGGDDGAEHDGGCWFVGVWFVGGWFVGGWFVEVTRWESSVVLLFACDYCVAR